jgi:hypothetical protein
MIADTLHNGLAPLRALQIVRPQLLEIDFAAGCAINAYYQPKYWLRNKG